MTATRNAATTRARIIAAASDEFGRHGIAGARVDRIARAARINKRMLYHYFGGKAQLYSAVLEAELAAGAFAEAAVGLGERLDAMQLAYAANGGRVRLLTWEALAAERSAIADERERRAEWRARVDRLREEQLAGKLRVACEPAQLELSLLALAMFPFAFPQLTRLIAGRSPDDPEFLAERREFFGALARTLESGQTPAVAGAEASPPAKPRYRLIAKVT